MKAFMKATGGIEDETNKKERTKTIIKTIKVSSIIIQRLSGSNSILSTTRLARFFSLFLTPFWFFICVNTNFQTQFLTINLT